MKLTVKTSQFQSMVSKSVRGAGLNKLLPITGMMCLEKKDGVLTLHTTDTANYLDIKTPLIEGDDMYVVVPADTFSKLIAKLTSDSITLTVSENSLEVSGNGKYKIPLPIDEEGMIQFPTVSDEFDVPAKTINKTTIKNIIDVNKTSMSRRLDTPCFCGYLVKDKVITTNEDVICINQINVFDEPVLISGTMMDLLSLNTQEKIDVYYKDGYFKFETADVVVWGPENDDKELFPTEDLEAYLNENFKSSCKVPKASLLNIIDRLSLFISPFDKNGAYFTFTKRGLDISSKEASSSEVLPYISSENFESYKCCVDIPQFKSELESIPFDEVVISYGHDAAIKLSAGTVVIIISLLEDDSLTVE